MKLRTIFLIIFFKSIYAGVNAQGCSDAGVCTINSFKNYPGNTAKDSLHSASLLTGIFYGIGEQKTNVYTYFAEFNSGIGKRISCSVKMTMTSIQGELAKNAGLSDLFLSSSYRLNLSGTSRSSIVLGMKIPLNHANAKNFGNPLPMVYQLSLGTYDLIAGYSLIYKGIGLSLGYQQPLINANHNGFIPAPHSFPNELGLNYLPTNGYQRKADILARLTYNLRLEKYKLAFRPGLLPIYHLGNDSYADASGQRISLDGSKGLTLNGTASIDFNLNKNNTFELTAARPFIARKTIPDGLLRHFLVGLMYRGKL
ncbi:MAG: hypothetical protein ACJ75J_14250 [Cytophagaceae bacterium]